MRVFLSSFGSTQQRPLAWKLAARTSLSVSCGKPHDSMTGAILEAAHVGCLPSLAVPRADSHPGGAPGGARQASTRGHAAGRFRAAVGPGEHCSLCQSTPMSSESHCASSHVSSPDTNFMMLSTRVLACAGE